jgi:Tol biopolymer transport system component
MPSAWLAEGNRIVFAATLADSTNLWTLSIDPSRWKVTGTPQRITFGAGVEISPSITRDRDSGQQLLAYANISSNTEVWSLAVDHRSAKASGELERLTGDRANDHSPFPSPDGLRVAFVSDRSGRWNVWLKELGGGRETALPAANVEAFAPVFSHDGSRLVYQAGLEYRQPQLRLSVISRDGLPGVSQRLCDGCARPAGFSADGHRVLYREREGERGNVNAIDIASGKRMELVNGDAISHARLSPDGGWLLFTERPGGSGRQLWIAPLNHALPVPRSEWISASGSEAAYAGQATWAPDGNLIYMVLERDTFRCIWAQRLDSKKHLIGSQFAVKHFHGSLSMMAFTDASEIGLNATRERLFFSLVESSGSIWLARMNK